MFCPEKDVYIAKPEFRSDDFTKWGDILLLRVKKGENQQSQKQKRAKDIGFKVEQNVRPIIHLYGETDWGTEAEHSGSHCRNQSIWKYRSCQCSS